MNSEEAEKLVWAAQTIFATGCELHSLASSHTFLTTHWTRLLSVVHVLRCPCCVSIGADLCVRVQRRRPPSTHIRLRSYQS